MSVTVVIGDGISGDSEVNATNYETGPNPTSVTGYSPPGVGEKSLAKVRRL
jgi:hypothetical protein